MNPLAYLVAKELSYQAFTVTLSKISSTMLNFSLTTSSDDLVKESYSLIKSDVPVAELKIVEALLIDFDSLRQQSKTVDTIMNCLNQSMNDIFHELSQIHAQISYYESCWFRSWRIGLLNIQPNINKIRKESTLIRTNMQLLKDLLPSCIIALKMRTGMKTITTTVVANKEKEKEKEMRMVVV